MNFKEALIAHLHGEKVEVCDSVIRQWGAFGDAFRNTPLGNFDKPAVGFEFRLAPRTITVNGVEVPAPESVAPCVDIEYYMPDILCGDLYDVMLWSNEHQDNLRLERGLVYLNKEDAIARAKAMLLTSDK